MASYGLYTSPPITYHLCKPYPWSYGLIRVRRRSKNDWKWARISLYLIKKRVFMREMLHLQALEYLWECQNCICDVLLSSKLVLDLNLEQKLDLGPTGNWTPVSRVTGGDTYHYTIEATGQLTWLGSNPCAFGSNGTRAVYAELQLYL